MDAMSVLEISMTGKFIYNTAKRTKLTCFEPEMT